MKEFLIKLSYTIFPIWAIVIGLVFYINLHVIPNATGGIGRLSLIPFGKDYDIIIQKGMLKDTLFQNINSQDKLKRISTDVLTIGDSFSQFPANLGTGGYQNYLSQKGLDVVNCDWSMYVNPIQFTYNIMDQIIDSLNTRFIILECVERNFESTAINFSVGKEEYERPQNTVNNTNNWSIARARDYIAYRIGANVPNFKATLDGDFFSSDDSNALYFYHDDIDLNPHIALHSELKIKETFKTLNKKANEKGIILIWLIAVDKYDLYQNHIVNNKWPHKTVNEDLVRILDNSPYLAISKHCLQPLIEKGEKDVFRFNDTHWSYKASKVVADDIYSRICSLSTNN